MASHNMVGAKKMLDALEAATWKDINRRRSPLLLSFSDANDTWIRRGLVYIGLELLPGVFKAVMPGADGCPDYAIIFM